MKYLLVDGFNLAFRAFYAVQELARSDGFPTNALYGWVRSLWKLSDDQKADRIVVFFDLGGSQDRLEIHPEYKANRAETPEAFEQQVPIIKNLTRAMGFGMVEIDGVESDDLLAAYAQRLYQQSEDAEILIVSADKDFAQTVNDRIHLLLPPPTANPRLGWRRLDPAGVKEKFGVPPSQIVDYLSLIGDSSDNIPGIAGVGPKTAAKWLSEYNDIPGILANLASIKPPRFQEILAAMGGRLALNRRLIAFDGKRLPVSIPEGQVDLDDLCAILQAMEMKTHRDEALRRYSQGELAL